MLIRRQLRSIPSGAPVVGASVELRLESNDTIIATTDTDGNGWYEFLMNGNPGPYYIISSYGSETQRTSSKVVGLSGSTDIGNLPLTFRNWKNGYIRNVLGQLQVTASGAGMTVTVAPGVHLTQGIIYDQYESLNFAIAAASTQPRIDRVVVEVVPTGAGENIEGRSRIVIKQGTPAATPVAPSLTQTTTLWQESLASILVDASVVAIASNKVTDERVAAWVNIPANSITTEMLQDQSVTNVKIRNGAVTAGKLSPNSVTDGALVDRSVTSLKIGLGQVYGSNIADGAITTEKIVDDHVTEGKLHPSVRTKLNSSGSGGGVSYRQSQYDDHNFDATGYLSGTRSLGSASVTVTSGSWLIESQLHFTARGGPGTLTAFLTGAGAPGGNDQSARIFEVNGVRQIILTGRRIVTTSSSGTYTVAASVMHQSGSQPDIRDGVIYVVATPR